MSNSRRKKRTRKKSRSKRGGSMLCGVCGATFDGPGAKDRLLEHCLHVHSKDPNKCSGTIPYNFSSREIAGNKKNNTFGRVLGKPRIRNLTMPEKIQDDMETQELLKDIDFEFANLGGGRRKRKTKRRKTKKGTRRRKRKTKRRKTKRRKRRR